MKTPEEQAEFIFNDIPKTDDPMQWKNWKYRIALSFENIIKDVRYDQEQKTKDSCFYIVNNAPVSVNWLGRCGIDRIDTIKKINDINTVKEKFKLKLGRKGLLKAAELEKGSDISAGVPDYIKANILPGFTDSQLHTIREALRFWNSIIIKGPGLTINFYVIDIDGPSGTLGAAAPTHFDKETGLPTQGIIGIDKADLERMEAEGRLFDVIKHEICHVLGFGTVWLQKGLLTMEETNEPLFVGEKAREEYNKIIGKKLLAIPVENHGSDGTRNSHWKESVFENELMTGVINEGDNPLSRMSLASLEDLGYKVSYDITDNKDTFNDWSDELKQDLVSVFNFKYGESLDRPATINDLNNAIKKVKKERDQ